MATCDSGAATTGQARAARSGMFLGLLLTCAVSAAADDRGGVTEPTPAPSLLVIVIDAQRADHLSSYGYPRATTPKLDAFAARGARFARVVSVSNRTGTSMSSMWTGMLPSRHGVFRTGDVLAESFTTVAELLRARGYRTGAWCPNPSLDRSFGHAQGWSTYDDDILSSEHAAGLPPWQRWETASTINERALRWIEQEPGKPFLAWLHYRDVHGPYVPPPPFDRMFVPLGERPLTEKEVAARPIYLALPDDGNDLLHYVSQYDGDVRYTDERVAELLADLERRGILDRTVVLITADHGEAFLDHGQWNHDSSLYEEELHVPLMIVRPGGTPQVIEQMVSSLDLFATLLDLAGAPVPPSDGESLIPLLDGRAGAYRRRQAYAESRAPWRTIQRAIRDERWKLIVHYSLLGGVLGRPTELYDLSADPAETRDLAALETARADRMAAELDLLVGRATSEPAPPRQTPAIDVPLRQRLDALGYVD